MATHTPGPWVIFYADGVSTIMPAGRPGDVADKIRNDADAYLIAAAPDLLAALKAAAVQFRFYEEQHMAKTPPDTAKARTNIDLAVMCEVAIAKAEAA